MDEYKYFEDEYADLDVLVYQFVMMIRSDQYAYVRSVINDLTYKIMTKKQNSSKKELLIEIVNTFNAIERLLILPPNMDTLFFTELYKLYGYMVSLLQIYKKDFRMNRSLKRFHSVVQETFTILQNIYLNMIEYDETDVDSTVYYSPSSQQK